MSGNSPAKGRLGDLEIQDAAAWILRLGVISSVSVMLAGLAISLFRGRPDVASMQAARFDPDVLRMLRSAASGDGTALMGLGIFGLVLTPIVRVAASAGLFAVVERDWFYCAVTLVVLALTLVSLLLLR